MPHNPKEQRLPNGSGIVIGFLMGFSFWLGLILGVMM